MDELEALREAVQDCDDCTSWPDDLCKKHRILYDEARRIEHERADPQRNRVGVRGDPVPDSEYGDTGGMHR